MAKIQTKKPPPKRKPGERAGLNRDQIIAAAIEMIEKKDLTIANVASTLKVAPGAVYAHFPDKLPEILKEMVRTALADVARPIHPNESWEAYLRDLFVAFSRSFHGHRNLAVIVGEVLSADYYLNPLLAERILLALSMTDLADGERAKALDLVMASLIGFIEIDCPVIGSQSPSQWVVGLSAVIDELPAGEHSETKALKSALSEVASERAAQLGAAEPSPARAHRFADHLIAGLKASNSSIPS